MTLEEQQQWAEKIFVEETDKFSDDADYPIEEIFHGATMMCGRMKTFNLPDRMITHCFDCFREYFEIPVEVWTEKVLQAQQAFDR
jgi:hypothetical protein